MRDDDDWKRYSQTHPLLVANVISESWRVGYQKLEERHTWDSDYADVQVGPTRTRSHGEKTVLDDAQSQEVWTWRDVV
jgi:hypothetical protein